MTTPYVSQAYDTVAQWQALTELVAHTCRSKSPEACARAGHHDVVTLQRQFLLAQRRGQSAVIALQGLALQGPCGPPGAYPLPTGGPSAPLLLPWPLQPISTPV